MRIVHKGNYIRMMCGEIGLVIHEAMNGCKNLKTH